MRARPPHKPRGLYLEGRLRLLHAPEPSQGARPPHLGRAQLPPFATWSLLLGPWGVTPTGGRWGWGWRLLGNDCPGYLPPEARPWGALPAQPWLRVPSSRAAWCHLWAGIRGKLVSAAQSRVPSRAAWLCVSMNESPHGPSCCLPTVPKQWFSGLYGERAMGCWPHTGHPCHHVFRVSRRACVSRPGEAEQQLGWGLEAGEEVAAGARLAAGRAPPLLGPVHTPRACG